jgi:protein-S-isoprenylcysteine O-methyltransferase Ste14
MWLFTKNLLFTVIVPGAVAVVLPRAILERWPSAPGAPHPTSKFVALAGVFAGATLYASALARFALSGRGTPAPSDPPATLVTSGPYSRVRNPMYVGVTLLLAGETLYFWSPALVVYTLGCFAAFHAFVVAYEEPHLRRRFEAPYAAYRAAVPRWIPRIGTRSNQTSHPH